jgi:hypothetical protein
MASTFLPMRILVIAAPWVNTIQTNNSTQNYYFGPGNSGYTPYQQTLRLLKVQMHGTQNTGSSADGTVTINVYKNTSGTTVFTNFYTIAGSGLPASFSVTDSTPSSAANAIITPSDDVIIHVVQTSGASAGTVRTADITIALEAEMLY